VRGENGASHFLLDFVGGHAATAHRQRNRAPDS
jgi:hypothetical protein